MAKNRLQELTEMHDGAIPGGQMPVIMARLPDGKTGDGKADMKKENRRNAPRKRSFAEFLRHRHRAEEEEWIDDEEPMNDFDRLDRNKENDPEYDQWLDDLEELPPEEDEFDLDPYAEDPDSEYNGSALRQAMAGFPENEEEWDFDEDEFDEEPDEESDDEIEDEFDDDDLPPEDDLEDGIDDDEIEDHIDAAGTFADFYRMDDTEEEIDDEEFDDVPPDEMAPSDDDLDNFRDQDDPREEEAEEIGPGGFEPGAGIGPDTQTQRKGAVGGGGKGTKLHRARVLFKQLINNPDLERRDMIDEFMKQLGVTESTAVSYYERIAKEEGMTNSDDDSMMADEGGMGDEEDPMGMGMEEEPEMEMSQEEIDAQDPDRKGIIRQVDDAHLVYKRQMEDGGFEELWSFNVADKLDDSLRVRRAILAGTDIPRGHTRSDDGSQTYTLTTMGNAQLLHITGLSN